MNAVLIDTDVFSFLFKGDSRAAAYVGILADHRPCLSFMIVAELHRWAIARRWGEDRRESLLAAIHRCVVLPFDEAMAETWAKVAVERARAGRPIECGDCWIAATAVRHGLPLATHNAGDFSGISGLRMCSAS
jgi:tRNA(fMet)-specific endonuclease VapC